MLRNVLMCTAVAAGSCLLSADHARAQGLVLQQPVVQQFGMSTVVSVPDRGSLLLGGVSSARSSRSTTGIFGPGASVGRDLQQSGMSVHVVIHNFEAMDRALLCMQPVGADRSRPSLEGMAGHARNQLLAREQLRQGVQVTSGVMRRSLPPRER